MSRKSSKPRILAAAHELLMESAGQPPTITEVAQRAGLSRQGVYLHFADRAELLLELSRDIDRRVRTPELQATIDHAPTGKAAVHHAVAVQAHIKPQLSALITAVEPLRHSDPAVKTMYDEREEARYQRVLAVIRRLDDDGDLASEWDVDTAAQLAWALMSQRVWEDLGWSDVQYITHLSQFLQRALCDEDDRGAPAGADEDHGQAGGSSVAAT